MTFSELISELYPVALDCGIQPETFWGSSLEEVRDRLESHRRVKVQTARESISVVYELAGLIGVYVSKLFDEKNEIPIPHPWDSYPELFKLEKRQYEVTQKAEQIEAAREARHAYAQRHNRIRRANGLI